MRLVRRLLLPALLLAAGLIIWRNQPLRQRLLRMAGLGEAPEGDPAELALAGTTPSPRSTAQDITSSSGPAGAAGIVGAAKVAASGSTQPAQPAPPAEAPKPRRPIELASRPDPDAGQLDAYGDDETTNDRVQTRLGRFLHDEGLDRLNINTQGGGVVFLRGSVRSQAQIDQILAIVEATEGVGDIVNELQVAAERG